MRMMCLSVDMMALCDLLVQTFLITHELSLCLHSTTAVFDKCRLKLSAFDDIDEYSLIYNAFYQLLNALLVHRTDAVFHLVPLFTAAVKRILSFQTCQICVFTLYLQIVLLLIGCHIHSIFNGFHSLCCHQYKIYNCWQQLVLYHTAFT